MLLLDVSIVLAGPDNSVRLALLSGATALLSSVSEPEVADPTVRPV